VKNPIDSKYQLLIGGKWVDGKESKTFNTINPANGELLSSCAEAGSEDVDLAVKAAQKAFQTWKTTSPQVRAAMLLKIADLLEANTEKLAKVETLNVGKPIQNTMYGHVPTSVDHFRYFASVIRSEDDQAKMMDERSLSIILREPIGVVGQIVPWNFPMLMEAWKLAPALAAGDTVVIKPSSMTSLSLLEMGKIMSEVLPPGVLNIVTGSGSTTGEFMLNHPGFRKLAFTGSTEVGYSVAMAAAKKLIPATLELGGKSADIIFPDAQFDKALPGAVWGILYNQGQVCSAGSRILVHEAIYDKFLEGMQQLFKRIKVGLPWEKETQLGSLISESQLKKVLSYVEIGKKEGAKVICGGYRLTEKGLDKGAFMAPTILADTDNKMRVCQEEIFGPVASVIKFKDEADAIKIANDSEYGLAGAVWTNDINCGLRVARAVEAGKMCINCYGNSPAGTPFGGYKKSGIGREVHKTVLDHYTLKKNIFITIQ